MGVKTGVIGPHSWLGDSREAPVALPKEQVALRQAPAALGQDLIALRQDLIALRNEQVARVKALSATRKGLCGFL